jgi:hypothetical protein
MEVTSVDPVTGDVIPVDLTNAAIALAFTAKRRLSDLDADKVFQKTRAAGGIAVVGDPTLGLIEVRLANADTSGLAAPVTLYWDLQLTSAGENTTLDAGLLYVEQDVTLA